jgi:hypothetical protein
MFLFEHTLNFSVFRLANIAHCVTLSRPLCFVKFQYVLRVRAL